MVACSLSRNTVILPILWAPFVIWKTASANSSRRSSKAFCASSLTPPRSFSGYSSSPCGFSSSEMVRSNTAVPLCDRAAEAAPAVKASGLRRVLWPSWMIVTPDSQCSAEYAGAAAAAAIATAATPRLSRAAPVWALKVICFAPPLV
jgi:hypothetical protein